MSLAVERNTNTHLANLDVLRALAVLGVLLHHTQAFTGYSFPFLGETGGLFGVELFFLISGYLITDSANKYTLREYTLHRFFRIFPAYLIVYVAFGLYQGTFFKTEPDPVPILLNLLNLQQLSPKALIEYDTIHVSWTLTVELLWYVVAPVLVVLFGKKRSVSLFVGAAIVSTLWSYLAGIGTFNSWFGGDVAGMSRPPTPVQMYVIVNNAFPAQLVFFVMGAMLYYHRDALAKLDSTFLWLLVVAFVLLEDTYLMRLPSPCLLTGIGLAALFIMVLRAPPSRNWLLLRIGKVSYSIYLIHFSIIIWANAHFAAYSKLVVILVAYSVIFALSNLMYEFIEKPFIRIGRSIANRSRPALLATGKA